MSLRRRSVAFRQSLGRTWDLWSFQAYRTVRRLWKQYGYLIGAVIALVAAVVVLFRKVPVGALGSVWLVRARARRSQVVFYQRMLRLLARRGIARPPTATAREFASTLAARPQVHSPVMELTTLYERIRFGGESLNPADERRAVALLQELATAPR
jgi:hypothetical protein